MTSFVAWQPPAEIETPRVCIDLAAMERNIARVAAALRRRDVDLRPHAKTHKSVQVARRQLAGGAVGLTTATIGEAEAFVDAGIEDVFIAYPLWLTTDKARRLQRLADRARIRIGTDSVEAIEQAARHLRGSEVRLSVELDSGEHRTGLINPSDAVLLAESAERVGLVLDGIFTHGGHSYAARAQTAAAAEDEVNVLAAAQGALTGAGFDVRHVSAGSTPTAIASARAPVTEERPGTFVFGDRQQVALGAHPADDVAMFVAATVVSATVPGQVVLDSGAKVLSKDAPSTLEGFGVLPTYPHAVIRRLFDHHALVDLGGHVGPRLGEVVAVVPNHACPVVNLAEDLVVCDGDRGIVDLWPVDARGRNR